MQAIDYRKDTIYVAKAVPKIVDVPKLRFIMVDGAGLPDAARSDNAAFQTAIQSLYGIVYTIKFWDKKFTPPSGYEKFTVTPLEGLWWTKNGYLSDAKSAADWRWTVMIRVPEFVTQKFFDQVVRECASAKCRDIYFNVRLEDFNEGKCVQIMHTGPYSEEQADIDLMHEFAMETGYEIAGKHHEIYLGDPRRTAPEKLRTILRTPVKIHMVNYYFGY